MSDREALARAVTLAVSVCQVADVHLADAVRAMSADGASLRAIESACRAGLDPALPPPAQGLTYTAWRRILSQTT